MTDIEPIHTDWLVATLQDASEALAAAIDLLERHPEEAEEVLSEELVAAYAKLNYAVNTARLGAGALDVMDDDELVAFPAGMPFLAPKEERE